MSVHSWELTFCELWQCLCEKTLIFSKDEIVIKPFLLITLCESIHFIGWVVATFHSNDFEGLFQVSGLFISNRFCSGESDENKSLWSIKRIQHSQLQADKKNKWDQNNWIGLNIAQHYEVQTVSNRFIQHDLGQKHNLHNKKGKLKTELPNWIREIFAFPVL